MIDRETYINYCFLKEKYRMLFFRMNDIQKNDNVEQNSIIKP